MKFPVSLTGGDNHLSKAIQPILQQMSWILSVTYSLKSSTSLHHLEKQDFTKQLS